MSDRDPIFLSNFWTGLFSLHGTEFLLSSAYHPQTYGQTEVINRCLETYLRCMCGEQPKSWHAWLPLAEWWYNTHFHSATQLTPYEVVYGQPPPLHLPYLPGDSDVEAVDRSLQKREEMIAVLRFHLMRAQTRMKQQADKGRSDRVFQEGDWVWLKLQPYRQHSVASRANQKLAPRFYGPFQIIAAIGAVAYKLQLPAEAKIHDVFHVSQLKSFHGTLPVATHIPLWLQGHDVSQVPQPLAILDTKVVKFQNHAQVQYLVQWENSASTDATWVAATTLEAKFPSFMASHNLGSSSS